MARSARRAAKGACTAPRPARSMIWSRRWAPTPKSPSRRCRGSAPSWMPRSPRSGTGRWPSSRSGMCSWTRLTARPASTIAWSPRPSWSPPAWPPTGAAKCSVSTSATARTAHFGPWGKRLGDPMLAASLLDRLLHRGIVVAIDGRRIGCALTSNAPNSSGRRSTPGCPHDRLRPMRNSESAPTGRASRKRFCDVECRKAAWRERHRHDEVGHNVLPLAVPAVPTAFPDNVPTSGGQYRCRTADNRSRSSASSSPPAQPSSNHRRRHTPTTTALTSTRHLGKMI